ncbi:TetR/AcrR family transcriptional regulator [Actinotalea ferrariae]|uniref:TetR/AcrR family transcriptional regulator n=1 Tax=Actinotalea ferrariae TaxID=1386098 RepID=UPI001C8B124D|nr:TetR/AcrR family transcriptional regulator [Actinotalea ferrariae]MBX9246721.1 TetR/AcrR family transcriptional regulator [Actinotalea ferrariae]
MDRERSGLQSAFQGALAGRETVVPVEAVVVPPQPRRADAARNRKSVLEAAARLYAERGVERVTMDDIAAAAGVGKGTLYRGFTDRSGLAMALLDERARALQEAVLEGAAPLGPGAPAPERLGAFVAAYLGFQVDNLDLVLLSESGRGPGARLGKGSYAFYRQHLAWLLQQAGAPDPRTRAEVLLGALAAEQVRHWVVVEGRDLADVERRLVGVARALLG